MGARFHSGVSAGTEATKGHVVQASGTDEPLVTPTSGMLEGHKPANFDAVRGRTDGAPIRRGAPVGDGSGPEMPGGQHLLGHIQGNPVAVGAEAPGPKVMSGNHNPVRSKGRATTEADRRPLSEAGA